MVNAPRCIPALEGRVRLKVVLLLGLFLTVLLLMRSKWWSSRLPLSFQRQLTDQELSALLQTLDALTSTLSRASIPFFMTSGTLIGSWRHHGCIPWDEDIDMAFLFVDRESVRRELSGLGPRYILNTDHPKRWKLFPASASQIPNVSWKFPFIDILFFQTNETHIWDEDVESFAMAVFPISDVFPLVRRPFQGRQLPAPRNTQAVLRQNYGESLMAECQTISYYHREETGNHLVLTLPCQALMSRHPFVYRVALDGGGCNETLVLNNIVLSWQAFPDQPC